MATQEPIVQGTYAFALGQLDRSVTNLSEDLKALETKVGNNSDSILTLRRDFKWIWRILGVLGAVAALAIRMWWLSRSTGSS